MHKLNIFENLSLHIWLDAIDKSNRHFPLPSHVIKKCEQNNEVAVSLQTNLPQRFSLSNLQYMLPEVISILVSSQSTAHTHNLDIAYFTELQSRSCMTLVYILEYKHRG